jgi:N-acetylglucosamine-6-phosphate deacetylase
MPESPFSPDGACPSIPDEWSGPGLVDLQLNGYAGLDFNGPLESLTAEAFHHVREVRMRRGVVSALPTLITCSPSDLLSRVRRYVRIVEADSILSVAFPRLHLEGPFISSEDGPRGAHPVEHCRVPSDVPDWLDEVWTASGGRIGLLTLAPELPGASDLITQAFPGGLSWRWGIPVRETRHSTGPYEPGRASRPIWETGRTRLYLDWTIMFRRNWPTTA